MKLKESIERQTTQKTCAPTGVIVYVFVLFVSNLHDINPLSFKYTLHPGGK